VTRGHRSLARAAFVAAFAPMRALALRLRPGMDVKREILAFCASHELPNAFIITAVGSVRAVKIRLANHVALLRGSTNATLEIDEQKFEICSLVGTITANGTSCHLHIALADRRGDVVGGHVLDGCIVFTTCEIVLGVASEFSFARELDAETGYDELVIARASETEERDGGDDVGRGKKGRRLRQMRAIDEERARRAETVEATAAESEPRGIFGFLANLIAPPPRVGMVERDSDGDGVDAEAENERRR